MLANKSPMERIRSAAVGVQCTRTEAPYGVRTRLSVTHMAVERGCYSGVYFCIVLKERTASLISINEACVCGCVCVRR